MKQYPTGRRLTALLLALCALLGLTACGSGGDQKSGDNTEQLSGTVYVPEFLTLDAEFSYISGGCCDGQNAYIVASIDHEEEVTDPETGETHNNHWSEEGIFQISLETGAVTKLENYEPSYSFANYDEGWFNLDSVRLGADGTLWVRERAHIYAYDLPEDFDEETGNKWEYQTNSQEVEVIRQLDTSGKELNRLDASGIREKLADWNYINNLLVGADGCFYVTGDGKIAVLDKDANLLFTLDDDSWGEFVLLNDGSVGMRRRTAEGSLVLSVLDKDAKGWGTAEYPLPYAASNLYDGTGKYLFYYHSGENLYGYNAETPEGERLLSWSSADINMERLVFFSFLPDGRVAAMTQDWVRSGTGDDYSSRQVIELAVLTEKDISEIPEKTVLTFATMGLGSDMRSSIIKFNKSSHQYRIEIKDYSEYSTENDYQAGLTKLNTEILAGNGPDLLAVSNLPIQQYAAKGLLEDLWPIIDSDPDISRDSLMERVFTAAERDGKLYQIFDGFSINTVVGSQKVVGDSLSWNLEDLKAALEAMPEGCSIFGQTSTKSNMLFYVLAMNVDSYVDWDTGKCSFDSDSFKSALEFCNSFPLEYDRDETAEYEDDTVRIAAGRQMLMELSLSDFHNMQIYEAMFAGEEGLQTLNIDYDYSSTNGSYTVAVSDGSGGSVAVGGDTQVSQRLKPGRYITFVGYPMEDGRCGSSFAIGNSVAMSSSCKDKEGAWSFIRELLLPEDSRKYYTDAYGWGFPSNKVDFDAHAAEAMKAEYMTDGAGNPILDQDGNPVEQSKGGWSWGNSLSIDVVATTQQEYDQIMELYNTITTISSYDTSIYDIVKDLADSYFNGDKSLDETVNLIQGRVQLYINENR